MRHPYSMQAYDIIPPAIKSGTVYKFFSDSGMEYEVRFARKKDDLLSACIAFGVTNDEFDGEEYIETNKGEVYRVMTTIVEIVKMYISEHKNVNSFEFYGEPTDGEDDEHETKRLKLYSRYFQRAFANEWNFEIDGNKMLVTR